MAPAKALVLVVLTAIVFDVSAASAQSNTSHSDLMKPLMPVHLEAHGALTWEGAVGAGFRAELPIVSHGVLHDAHDELTVSAGSDFILASFGGTNPMDIWPTVALQWNLGLNDRVAFYPELGITAKIDRDGWQGVLPNVGFGGRYYIWRSFSVVARFGWPMAFSVGLSL